MGSHKPTRFLPFFVLRLRSAGVRFPDSLASYKGLIYVVAQLLQDALCAML